MNKKRHDESLFVYMSAVRTACITSFECNSVDWSLLRFAYVKYHVPTYALRLFRPTTVLVTNVRITKAFSLDLVFAFAAVHASSGVRFRYNCERVFDDVGSAAVRAWCLFQKKKKKE